MGSGSLFSIIIFVVWKTNVRVVRARSPLCSSFARDAIHFGLSRICRNCIGVTGSAVETVVETVVNSVETVDYVL